MKIIRRNADNVVLYTGNDLVLDAEGVRGAGWTHPGLTGVSLVEAVDPPSYWLGCCFTYIGTTWAVIPARQADVDQHIADLAAAAASAAAKETDWLIDIGPFFDRFGAAKMPVLTSADAGVQAIIKDAQVRKWIDLKNPNVPTSLDYIMTKVAALTGSLKTNILTTPVAPEENLALRKLYFS